MGGTAPAPIVSCSTFNHGRQMTLPRLLRSGLVLATAAALTPGQGWAASDGDGVMDPALGREVLAKARASATEVALRRYLEAAESYPVVAEWLLLRTAILTRDGDERAALYARIRMPVVRARALAAEAVAREAAGDLNGAAIRYDSLGRMTEGMRLRLRLAWTRDQRLALRGGLLAVARERPSHPESREALQYLATVAVDLAPQEALEAARLASASGLTGPAVKLYARAARVGLSKPQDVLAYGSALASQRRHREAIRVLSRLASDSVFGPEVLYRQAWSYARLGDSRRAETALGGVFARASEDPAVRPRALFLAGDLAWQRGEHMQARERWTELVRRYPGADSVGRAGFLAALALYEVGQTAEAAREWERVHLIDGGTDGLAAGYWGGRAWTESGDTQRAAGLWQSVMARDSTSYYAVLSARRLNVAPWRPAPAAEGFASYTDIDSAMARLQLLDALGMDEEVAFELNWLLRGPGVSPERALAIADGLRRIGQSSAAVAAARRALAVGAAPDARTYRLLYPWHFGESIAEQSTLSGVDPRLVAALIRQESSWEPRARSRVGAVGLMQVMPATGRLIARSLGVRGWRSDHLLEPATNLRFGTWFLAQSLRRWDGDLSRALAAYNAGGTRVPLWSTGRAASDPELFVERISFKETRDYVRIIQRNLGLYEALYPDLLAATP